MWGAVRDDDDAPGKGGERWPGLSYPMEKVKYSLDWLQRDKLEMKRVSALSSFRLTVHALYIGGGGGGREEGGGGGEEEGGGGGEEEGVGGG